MSLGEVLSADDEHSEAVRETLAEITGTYRVVKSAIESFAVAGQGMSQQRGGGFAALAHGVLADSIHNGRAHCTRIGIRYEKTGGLHDALEGRLPREHLASLDKTFERLANADGDVFSAMDSVGQSLTTEARLIERLLLTRRTQQADEEFARAMDRLAPLEEALDRAISDMRNVSVTLGYAEKGAQEETAYVTNQTITIHGSVVNSAVVAADRIEDSAIKVGAAEISDELRSTLVDLHKAVAELTSRLPDDEAALAARDPEDLTRDATSPSPRPAWWRRAMDGLISAAKAVTEAGIPVIELVTKVAALLG